MARRNRAKYLAIAGAIRGISQGINDYQSDKRRASLREIELQYRANEKAEDRRFRAEEKAADRAYQEGRDEDTRAFQEELVDKRNTNAIALFDKGREFNWNDPNLSARYSNVGEAKKANDPTMLQPVKKTGTTPSSISATEEYMDRGEEFQKNFDRINKISDKEGGLTAKQSATYVTDQLKTFNGLGKRDKVATLKQMGIDPELTGNDLKTKLRQYYVDDVNSINEAFTTKPEGAISLMSDAPDPVAPVTTTAAAGNPGSSKENPAPASSFQERPPSGTWVTLSNGNVVQIP